MKTWLSLLPTLLLSFTLSGQKPPETLEEYQERYERRIKQVYLNEVYIPEDLGDAFIQFNKLISAASKQKFKSMPESDAAVKLHFSFGRWMIVNWGFYEGSRFSHYLKKLGLSHPDDMARFVILMYHRDLNKVPLEPKQLINDLVEERRAAYLEKREKSRVVISETRIPAEKSDSLGGNR